MTKKKWILVILAILLLAVYYKLFYKTWSNNVVTQNADYIIAVDVKKITNTVIWNIITTPSQWKSGKLFPPDDGKVSWDDMVALPDYVFIFHKAGQPGNAFYTVLKINNAEDFQKGLQQYHFTKTPAGSFLSTETGIELVQNGENVLVGNAAVGESEYIQQVADELFNKKDFIVKDSLGLLIKGKSHLSAMIPLPSNNLTMFNQLFIQGNFDKNGIYFDAAISTKHNINLTAQHFTYNDSSLLSAGFTLPWPDLKQALSDSLRNNMSKLVNFNIDSLLLQSNNYYQFDMAGIYPRIDSAISYTYDDNLNPVENVVVNNVEEPAFNFTVKGDSVFNIYNYWINSGKIETNGDSNLFTPVPFVKSYCTITEPGKLVIQSNNYKDAKASQTIECVFYFRLLLSKIPPSFHQYIPASVKKLLQNIQSAEAKLSYTKKEILGKPSIPVGLGFHVSLMKNKNDLPLFDY